MSNAFATAYPNSRKAFVEGPLFCSMRITGDVRRYAEEHGMQIAEAIEAGLAEKAAEFKQSGGEIYVDANVSAQ
jgi:phosphomethylpyrimidine synthase